MGPGRAGVALGLLLSEAGGARDVVFAGRAAAAPPGFPSGPRLRHLGPVRHLPPDLDALIVAVPDAMIAAVAAELAAHLPHPPTTLHLSGARGSDALAPLAALGAAVGSLHPLIPIPDAETGRVRLRGAWFGVEGEGAAARLAAAIVAFAGGRALAVAAGAKPLYHAGAVLASNLLVAQLAAAERWWREAGIEPSAARAVLAGLAAAAVADVQRTGPVAALTGPVARGDAETVALHLARLSPADRRLYSLLAAEALGLAREAGLADPAADALAELLPTRAPATP